MTKGWIGEVCRVGKVGRQRGFNCTSFILQLSFSFFSPLSPHISFLSFPPYSFNVIFLFIFVFRVGKAGRQRGSTAPVFFCSFHFPYYFPLFFPLSPSYHFNMIVLFILVSSNWKSRKTATSSLFCPCYSFLPLFCKTTLQPYSCQVSLFYI